MLRKETGRIDWSVSAKRIIDLVRGVDPWPGAFTTQGADTYKIWRAEALEGSAGELPGTVLCADARDGLVVAACEGMLRVLTLQAPGTKRMPAAEYLRSHPMRAGMRFGGEVRA
jgi:methionyl-tRNA formyltransferase